MSIKRLTFGLLTATLLQGCSSYEPTTEDTPRFEWIRSEPIDEPDGLSIAGVRQPNKVTTLDGSDKTTTVEHYWFSIHFKAPEKRRYSLYERINKDGRRSGERCFMFDNPHEPETTKYFTIEDVDGYYGGRYSLKTIDQNDYIAKEIYQCKTFGGMPPTLHIDVINSRFIAFPETIGKGFGSKMFNPMEAVTHIYDLKTGKIVYKSEPYTYDRDVPLEYDLKMVSGFD